MAGHLYLGKKEGERFTRYFIRPESAQIEDEKALEDDLEQAKKYEWRLRSRSTGHLKSTVYSRNFSFEVGQPASFEEQDKHPCAVEYLFGALAGSLATAFSTECAKENLEVDDIDVRTPEEYAFIGHPEMVWNIPFAFVTYQRKDGKT